MNQKVRRKINIIDILILIALLAALLVAGMGIARGNKDGESVTVRYIIQVDSINNDYISKLAAKNSIYDHNTSSKIGTVTAVSHSKAYYENSESPIEGYSVLYITAEAQAIKTDTGYAVGSTIINIGRKMELRFPNLYCQGKCVSIEITK